MVMGIKMYVGKIVQAFIESGDKRGDASDEAL